MPASHISFTCAWTESEGKFFRTSPWKVHHQQSWSHVLLSLYSTSLQTQGKRSYDTQLTGLGQWPDFCLTTYLGQINPAAERVISSSAQPCWIPCISSNFSRVLGVTFTGGYHICNYHLGDFNTLGDSDQGSCQVFHYYHNMLAPSNHFGVCVHHTQTVRQVGSITPFQGFSHDVHVVSKKQGPCLVMY